jgi:hypothetical protein
MIDNNEHFFPLFRVITSGVPATTPSPASRRAAANDTEDAEEKSWNNITINHSNDLHLTEFQFIFLSLAVFCYAPSDKLKKKTGNQIQ